VPASVDELASHAFVDQSDQQLSDRTLLDAMIGTNAQRRFTVSVNSSFAQVLAAERGMGIVVVPSYFSVLGGRLVAIDCVPSHAVPIYVCYRREAGDQAYVRATIDWLKAALSGTTYPWFRRDFIRPARFESEISSEEMRRIRQLHAIR
jgi:DNA-binding transcriptional LysR family regulator